MKELISSFLSFWKGFPTWLRRSFAILILLLIAVKIGYSFLISSKAPRLSGELKVPGLVKPVSIVRDSYGVPHIRSEDPHSAYFALGYVSASDRIFQMEILRKAGRGELSEILGPDLVPTDVFLRQMLLRRSAEKMLSARDDSSEWKKLDSFLEGLNFFLKTEPLPVEFTLLGYQPKPFDRLDVLSSMALLSFSFSEAFRNDSLYSILESRLKNDSRDVSELFPRHDHEDPFSILENQPAYSPKKLAVSSGQNFSLLKNSNISNSSTVHHLEATVRKATDVLKGLPLFTGSNSWVIAPSRSSTGGAILANDPHIEYGNPGTWYEVHMIVGEFESYGYHFPLVPFPLIAHNARKAWALTMLENDDMDLYEETFHPTKPNLVMEKGEWVPVQILKETIAVKGEESREIEIQVTSHGPIVSKPIPGYAGPSVSLYWVFHHLSVPLLKTIYTLDRCASIGECEQVASGLPAPGLNVSYADRDGNIAWWGVGRFPIRKTKRNTRKILNGSSGEDDVVGYLPFSQNPRLVNPKEGIILTANHLPATQLSGYGKPEGYWQESDRARRIYELLGEKKLWSVDDMKKIQTDIHSFAARSFVPLISEELKKSRKWEGVFREALDVYEKFDGENTLDSPGATLFHTMNQFVMINLWQDELGEEDLNIFGQGAERWNAYKYILFNESSTFWDDLSTPQIREMRRDILARAFLQTVRFLANEHGGAPSSWTWGKAHKITFEHPIGKIPALGLIFNQGPFPVSSGEAVINLMNQKEIEPKMNPHVGPSKRRIIDLSDPENSWSVLPTGNSGNQGSPFYGDQIDLFLKGEYRPIRFTQSQIEQDSKHVLKLIPEK